MMLTTNKATSVRHQVNILSILIYANNKNGQTRQGKTFTCVLFPSSHVFKVCKCTCTRGFCNPSTFTTDNLSSFGLISSGVCVNWY